MIFYPVRTYPIIFARGVSGNTPPTLALLPRYGLGLHPGRKYPDIAPLWANEGGLSAGRQIVYRF